MPTPSCTNLTVPPHSLLLLAGSSSNGTDSSNHTWLADRDYQGGLSYYAQPSQPVYSVAAGDWFLYHTNRFGDHIEYSLPVLELGRYAVKLYFVEVYWNGTGQRVFDVSVQGVTVWPGWICTRRRAGSGCRMWCAPLLR